MVHASGAFGALVVTALATGATTDLVVIGRPGNAPDTNGLGAVAESYALGQFEVTNDEYVAFLNAVADEDPHGLFDPLMTSSGRGGILRFGAAGSHTYFTKPGFGDRPVVAIDWLDAARFCNWLHHDRPVGPASGATTEDGAYDLSAPHALIARRPGARWFIPTHDEWYKAAYYDPDAPGADAGGTTDYWLYPYRTDVIPIQATVDDDGDVLNPGANVANYARGADWNDENGNVTVIGACAARSPWNIFDLGGNANEMTETPGNPIPPNPPRQPEPLPTRTIRGGDFSNEGVLMASPDFLAPGLNMIAAGANIGLRVAATTDVALDLDEDGSIDFGDLVALLSTWGSCPPIGTTCAADVNGDRLVGFDDLLILLEAWSNASD